MRQIEFSTDRKTLKEFARESRDGSGGVIFVPVSDPPNAGERVRVVIRFEGFEQDFAMTGTCVTVRRKGRASLPAGATIEISGEHLAGLRKALHFARGEAVPWHQREHQRTTAKLPSRIAGSQGETAASLLDLSLGGARVTIDGELPSMGEEVSLVVEPSRGFFPLRLRGQVMWLSYFSGSRSLGLKFVGGGFGWKRKLAALLARMEVEAAAEPRSGNA